MEGIPNKIEKDAPIGLDAYLECLFVLDSIDGIHVENDVHAFYIWIPKAYPEFADIDGVSLTELYRLNVLEGDMTEAVFFDYCTVHKFPVPLKSELTTYYVHEFEKYITELSEEKISQYEEWASQHGIETQPGAIMKFIDAEGNMYRIQTDSDNRGVILE